MRLIRPWCGSVGMWSGGDVGSVVPGGGWSGTVKSWSWFGMEVERSGPVACRCWSGRELVRWLGAWTGWMLCRMSLYIRSAE